jgi:hypothetical protein
MTEKNSVQKTIIDELGLSDLPEDKKEQLVLKMTEAVLKRIFLETMEKLSEKEQEEYAKMIDENATPQELETFLREKISGYDEMVQKTIADFKEQMKAVS